MTPTSTPIAAVFVKEILEAIDEGTKQAAHMLWSALLSFLTARWLALMILVFIVFVVATLKAMFGRWGMLGSVLYNSIYFGILFIIWLVWGPEIFVSDFFSVAYTIILYPVCYFVTGLILDKIGVK